MTITSESSAYCGQLGRLCRVFWRPDPWVLIRLCSGGLQALPWNWTDLPQPDTSVSAERHQGPAALLSPAALLELVRFHRSREEPRASVSHP